MENVTEIDLQAFRCPSATTFINRILREFVASSNQYLRIYSIEPSIERNIEQRIAHLYASVIQVNGIRRLDITNENKAAWESTGQFDEDDYSDVDQRLRISIEKC